MRNVLTLILGGGQGSRLYPLTRERAKPAVPLAGKYRLIDVAISNCINSGMKKINVMTQYLSASLNRHISQTYAFDQFSQGFVDVLAAEQTAETQSWFQGTADAVRKHWRTLDNADCDLIMILPGDALYRMDYRPMIEQHIATGAQVTLAVNTVPQKNAHHFGLLELDESGEISAFKEKPKTREEQKGLEAPKKILERFGIADSSDDIFLASMGVYLFNRDVLDGWLMDTEHVDFGKQIIPDSIKANKVYGYIFDGYWEDIGTIDAFYQAHMDFLAENPPFQFAKEDQPIYTRARFLPSTRIAGASLDKSVVADGCHIGQAKLHKSVIGLRARIDDHTTVEDSIVMGADFYREPCSPGTERHESVELGIGKYCHIKKAIIDKNVRIGDHVHILNPDNIQHADGEFYFIREGITIIPKNAVIPANTKI